MEFLRAVGAGFFSTITVVGPGLLKFGGVVVPTILTPDRVHSIILIIIKANKPRKINSGYIVTYRLHAPN